MKEELCYVSQDYKNDMKQMYEAEELQVSLPLMQSKKFCIFFFWSL